jgi:pyrroline-5-carboxylate reductase
VIEQADIVVLAVKPQHLANVARELGGLNHPHKLLISLLAGVRIQTLCEVLRHQRVIRVMPNTPCLVGSGASAYALGPEASAADGRRVAEMLGAVGLAVEVDEKLMDAVTGLSGSGPAYIYTVIEALSDGGVRAGLPREIATRLAAQTVLGAAQMVLSTAEHPAVLKERVTSPGGTTIAGLQALERAGVRAAFMGAVEAATQRSIELGRS